MARKTAVDTEAWKLLQEFPYMNLQAARRLVSDHGSAESAGQHIDRHLAEGEIMVATWNGVRFVPNMGRPGYTWNVGVVSELPMPDYLATQANAGEKRCAPGENKLWALVLATQYGRRN